MSFKLLGITDEIGTCDCCGRVNLKCTVALENEAGDTVYYGRDCAGAALYGSKNARNTKLTEQRARMVQKCRDALPIIVEAMGRGIDRAGIAKVLPRSVSASFGIYSDTGNKMPLRIYADGWSTPGVELSASQY